MCSNLLIYILCLWLTFMLVVPSHQSNHSAPDIGSPILESDIDGELGREGANCRHPDDHNHFLRHDETFITAECNLKHCKDSVLVTEQKLPPCAGVCHDDDRGETFDASHGHPHPNAIDSNGPRDVMKCCSTCLNGCYHEETKRYYEPNVTWAHGCGSCRCVNRRPVCKIPSCRPCAANFKAVTLEGGCCPGCECPLQCPYGRQVDEHGHPICECNRTFNTNIHNNRVDNQTFYLHPDRPIINRAPKIDRPITSKPAAGVMVVVPPTEDWRRKMKVPNWWKILIVLAVGIIGGTTFTLFGLYLLHEGVIRKPGRYKNQAKYEYLRRPADSFAPERCVVELNNFRPKSPSHIDTINNNIQKFPSDAGTGSQVSFQKLSPDETTSAV